MYLLPCGAFTPNATETEKTFTHLYQNKLVADVVT